MTGWLGQATASGAPAWLLLIQELAPILTGVASIVAAYAALRAARKARAAQVSSENVEAKVGNGFADDIRQGHATTHQAAGRIETRLNEIQREVHQVKQETHNANIQAGAAAAHSRETAERVDIVAYRLDAVAGTLHQHIEATNGRVRGHGPATPPQPSAAPPAGRAGDSGG